MNFPVIESLEKADKISYNNKRAPTFDFNNYHEIPHSSLTPAKEGMPQNT